MTFSQIPQITTEHLKLAVAQTSENNDNAAFIEFLLITGMKEKGWGHGLPQDAVTEILQPFKELEKLHPNQELVVRLVDIHLESEFAQKVKPALNEPQKDSWWSWGTKKDHTKVLYWSPLVAKIIDDGCDIEYMHWCINNTSWWVQHPCLPNLSINTLGRTRKQTLLDIHSENADSPGIPELIMYQGGMTKEAFLAECKKRAESYKYRHEVQSMNGSVSLGSKPVDTATTDWCKPYLYLDVKSKKQVRKFFIKIVPLIAQGKLRPTQKIRGKSLLLLATKHGLVREMSLFLNHYAVPVEQDVFDVASKNKSQNELVLAGYKERCQEKLDNPDCQENYKYYGNLSAVDKVQELRQQIQTMQMKALFLETMRNAQKVKGESGDSTSARMTITFDDPESERLFEEQLRKNQKKKADDQSVRVFPIKRNKRGEGIPLFMQG